MIHLRYHNQISGLKVNLLTTPSLNRITYKVSWKMTFGNDQLLFSDFHLHTEVCKFFWQMLDYGMFQ